MEKTLTIASLLSVVGSLGLWFTGDQQAGIFVGLWAPTLLMLPPRVKALLGKKLNKKNKKKPRGWNIPRFTFVAQLAEHEHSLKIQVRVLSKVLHYLELQWILC